MDIFGIVESQKFAKALAEEAGIRVEEQSDSSIAPFSSAPGRIVVGKPCAYGAEDYMSSLHKEIAKQHKSLRFLYEYVEEKKEDPMSCAATSIIHRHKGEKKGAGVYLGRDRLLAYRYEKDTLGVNLPSAPAPLQQLFWHLNEDRGNWQGSTVPMPPPEGHEEYSWIPESIDQVNDKFSLERFLRRLYEQDEDSGNDAGGESGESEESSGEPGGGPSGQGGTGDPGGGDGGSGEGSPPDSGSEGSGEQEYPDGGNPASGEQQPQDSPGAGEGSSGEEAPSNAQAPQGQPGDGHDAQQSSVPGGIGGSIESLGSFTEPPFDRPPVNSVYEKGSMDNFQPSNMQVKNPGSSFPSGSKQRVLENILKKQQLSKSMRKYLIAEKQVGYQYGLKRGKVCPKSIGKLYSAGNTQPRIFKERSQSRINQNIAVFILGDCSGSMTTGHPSRYLVSAACQISLSSVLLPLQIPHFMALFTTYNRDLEHYIMKTWDENPSREKLITRYSSTDIRTDCNGDGESVLWAAQILAQRKEQRKLLIVLSDGEPAHNSGSEAYLEHVCKVIESSRGIELVGIGIQSDAVKNFYKNHAVVKNMEDLEPTLLDVLKKNVVKRG